MAVAMKVISTVGKWTGLSNPNNPLSDLRQVTIEKNSENNFIINEKIGSYNAYGKKMWMERKIQSTDIATLKRWEISNRWNFIYLYRKR